MKKIFITLACATLAFAGCKHLNEMPVFDASESFASFPSTSVSVDEDKGQVSIPVQIASIDPVKTVVSYEILDGNAKAGVNFKDTNPDAVITFGGADGEREHNIVIDIVNLAGTYTGDLDFTIRLVSASGLKLSMENTCKVTIGDLDHPLAAILGEYNGTATSYWDGDVSWTMTLLKDPSDISVVWIDGITNEFIGESLRFYANVDFTEDGEISGFTAPAGQFVGYPGVSAYSVRLCGGNIGAMRMDTTWSLSWYLDGTTFSMNPEAESNTVAMYIYGPNDNSVPYGWYNFYTVAPSFTKK